MITHEPTRTTYAMLIKSALERLRKSRFRIHIPPQHQLFSQQTNAPFHPYPEVFLQTGGATEFNCPGSTFILETGEACVMPRGLPHAETPLDRDTPYAVFVIGISMGRLFLIQGHNPQANEIESYGFDLLEDSAGSHLAGYLDDICNSLDLTGTRRTKLAKALLEAFWILTLREIEKRESESTQRHPRLITQVEHYARIHLNDPNLSVQRIAKALNCTPDHVSRQFKRSMSIGLTRWIAGERIAQAKQLLASGEDNVSEIGWRCGFSSTTYFIRTFKQFTEITPKAYRHSLS